MPLQSTNMYAGGPIKAADVIQFFNLFTGSMTDQPVTFANTLTVGGSQSNASVPLRISSQATGTARVMEIRTLQADVNPVFGVDRLGVLSFGPGGGTVTDTTITRVGVNQLTFSGGITTNGNLHVVSGGLSVDAGWGSFAGGMQVTAGNVGVGGAPVANIGIYVQSSALTGASQYGITSAPSGSSAATGGVWAFVGNPATAAGAFTSTDVGSFLASAPVKGGGSTITNAYGLYVNAINTGNAGNFGVYINAPSGGSASNIGIYNLGTTQLQGNVGIGGASGGQIKLGLYGTQVSAGGSGQGLLLNVTLQQAQTNDQLYQLQIAPSFTNPGSFSNAVGAAIEISGFSGNSGLGTVYGLHVNAITGGAGNNYGIYVAAPSGASGVNAAIYSTGKIIMTSAALPARVAGDVYLVWSPSLGEFHQSAIGPAS